MALTKISRSLLDTGVSDSSDATAITIDSSENVGIGETSPLAKLHIKTADSGASADSGADELVLENSGDTGMTIMSGTSNSGSIRFGDSGDNDNGIIIYNHGSSPYMRFFVDGSERLRIDNSGNVFIATTSAARTTAGHEFHTDGFSRHTVDGDKSMELVRTSSFGEMVEFFKDSGQVGTIGAYTTSRMYIGSGDTGLTFAPDYDAIYPVDASTPTSRDNAIDLGYITVRFDDVYATNGTIQTSDQNEKNTIANSDLGLDFVKQLSPKSYKFNGKTRTHYGLIAQDVETVLSDINKPTTDFAGFIKGDISEEQDGSNYRYGLRYTEFISPLIKAIQEQQEQIEALQAEINTLKGE